MNEKVLEMYLAASATGKERALMQAELKRMLMALDEAQREAILRPYREKYGFGPK